MEGMQGIFSGKFGTPDDLHLMDFQDIKWKGRDDRSLPETLLSIFPGQSEDDVPSGNDPSPMSGFHSFPTTCKVMPTVDTSQGFVIRTFYAIFNHHESAMT